MDLVLILIVKWNLNVWLMIVKNKIFKNCINCLILIIVGFIIFIIEIEISFLFFGIIYLFK